MWGEQTPVSYCPLYSYELCSCVGNSCPGTLREKDEMPWARLRQPQFCRDLPEQVNLCARFCRGGTNRLIFAAMQTPSAQGRRTTIKYWTRSIVGRQMNSFEWQQSSLLALGFFGLRTKKQSWKLLMRRTVDEERISRDTFWDSYQISRKLSFELRQSLPSSLKYLNGESSLPSAGLLFFSYAWGGMLWRWLSGRNSIYLVCGNAWRRHWEIKRLWLSNRKVPN